MTNEEEVVRRLLILKDYYNSQIKDEILTLWAKDLLEDYDIEEIKTAIQSYRKNETYPPTLAGIINYIPKTNIDYAHLILQTVWKYGSNSESGMNSLKDNELAQELYRRYGTRVGNSEPYSTDQTFLFKEINEEAYAKERYNKTTTERLEHKEQKLIGGDK